MRLQGEFAGDGQALRDLGFGVARTEFAALRIVSQETLEGGPGPGQRRRQIEQGQEWLVAGNQAKIAIEYRNALIEQVEPGLQQIVRQRERG